MAQLNKNTFEGKFNSSSTGLFKTNTTKDIGSDDMRTMIEDLTDSFLNKSDEMLDEDDMSSNSAAAVPTQQSVKTYVDASATTRESGRAASTELLFDKNVIQMDITVQSGPLTFTIADAGHLSGQESVIETKVQSNGVDPINFEGVNYFSNIAQGEVLEAGTYQVFFLRMMDGTITVSVVKPSLEANLLIPLAIPADFTMVPGGDPDTELDATWVPDANNSSQVIELSEDGGGGPWILPVTLAGNATSYTRTGLTPNTTYHQRLRGIGDGVVYQNSGYAITAATTQDAGDVTAPTFTFFPLDAATDVVVNRVVEITASEPIRDSDGVTEITNANITDYVTATASVSGAVSITGTIDATKTAIAITPVGGAWPENEDITITIDGVEDMNGNAPAADSATFTTSDFSEMILNTLSFGTVVDSIISGADTNFELEFEFEEISVTGAVNTSKHESVDSYVSHVWETNTGAGHDGRFKYYRRINAVSFRWRNIVWAGAFNGVDSGKATLKYFGAVDTNNGIDRAELYIDDVLVSAGKSMTASADGGGVWPWDISGGPAPFKLSGHLKRVRNFKLRTDMGATTVIDVPIIRTGIDVSGNGYNGTWA